MSGSRVAEAKAPLAASLPAGTVPSRRGMALSSMVGAVVLALTPVTAILVLGWLVRVMRREAALALAQQGLGLTRRAAVARLAATPALADLARFPGWWRGFGDTVRSGLCGTLAVSLATLPFGALLMLAWWAGWENSFNKGYEQAWVGPVIAFLAAAVAVPVLSLLPIALAHHAVTRRIGAVLDIAVLWRLVRLVRWSYVVLALATLLAAAPLGVMRVLPVLIESFNPEFARASHEAAAIIAFRWHLAATAYMIVMLVVLRSAAARLYARAWLAGPPAGTNEMSAVAAALGIASRPATARRPRRLTDFVAGVLIAAVWLAFLAMLYVTQFANHGWWNWLNHPIVGLPWVFRPF